MMHSVYHQVFNCYLYSFSLLGFLVGGELIFQLLCIYISLLPILQKDIKKHEFLHPPRFL